MPPQILSMKDIRRFYPSRTLINGYFRKPENRGCIFGIISKTGAMPKTRTMTMLRVKQHKLTGKVSLRSSLIFRRFERQGIQ